jgi:hypothetical protein
VFIDNPMYWDMAEKQGVNLGVILGEHFEKISDVEYGELLK